MNEENSKQIFETEKEDDEEKGKIYEIPETWN